MNVFANFDEIPSMILQDIKETKCYGHTVGHSYGRTDNMKTVYPPTNIVCGGIKIDAVTAEPKSLLPHTLVRDIIYLKAMHKMPREIIKCRDDFHDRLTKAR